MRCYLPAPGFRAFASAFRLATAASAGFGRFGFAAGAAGGVAATGAGAAIGRTGLGAAGAAGWTAAAGSAAKNARTRWRFASLRRRFRLNRALIDKEIDRVLRDCVSVAVKRDGTKDILGSPWFRKRAADNEDDDDLLHPYGGLRYLSYEAASESIGIRELKLKKKSP